MTRHDLIVIWLSLQISILSWFWMKAEKRVSYLEGQQAIWDAQTEAEQGGPNPCKLRDKQGVCEPYTKGVSK